LSLRALRFAQHKLSEAISQRPDNLLYCRVALLLAMTKTAVSQKFLHVTKVSVSGSSIILSF
ncbi:MAG: hypothetical protein ACNYWU_04475, partial [Desulfobacterales bacterium]